MQTNFISVTTIYFINLYLLAASASADELALGLAYFSAVNTGARHVVSIIKGAEEPSESDLENVGLPKMNRERFESKTGGGAYEPRI